jgi:hypothetical protein
VLVAGHCFEALGEVSLPIELDLVGADLVEEIASQDEVVLIILHQQNSEGLAGVHDSNG